METQNNIARIRRFALDGGWNKTRLALEAGLHQNTLRHFWSQTWNPRAETMSKLDALITQEGKS